MCRKSEKTYGFIETATKLLLLSPVLTATYLLLHYIGTSTIDHVKYVITLS